MGMRIRWANVLRVFAVLAAMGLVVAWPRLGPPEVVVPPAGAVPVASVAPEEFAAPVEASPAPRRGRRSAPARPKRPRVRRTAQVRKPRVPAPAAAGPPAAVAPADPVGPPIRRVYRARPLPEFGVE